MVARRSPHLRMKSTWAKPHYFLVILLIFCRFSAIAQCFLPSLQVGNNTSRRSIAVGDFNKDGRLDFVTANNNTSISLFIGNGMGGFLSPVSFGTGSGSQTIYVVAADFNADGWLDVATASFSNATFSVLLNNQVGGFSPFTAYVANTNPRSLAVGDFNNDLILDIAVTNYNNNSLSVRLGDGLGGFGGSVSVPTSFFGASLPHTIISGDYNRDGNIDLAVTMVTGNRVLIFEGDGTGNFPTTPRSYTTGNGPNSIITNDFNGDGLLDMAVANQFGNTITVRLGTVAAPFFGGSTAYATGSGTQPTGLTSGDFNGDGILDIAVAQQGIIGPPVVAGKMSVFLGTGSGTFLPRTDFAPNSGARPQGIAAADFNGDGLLDIATANDAANSIDRGISIFRAIAAPTLPVLNVVQPTCLVPTATITVVEQNVGDAYSFDNGSSYQSSNVFNPTLPGTYNVIIQNSNGCTSPVLPVVIDPLPASPPQPTIANVVQPNCANTNGSFEVVVQDATDEYSANGSPFTTSNIFTGLASGSFSVTTKNQLGCVSLPTVIELQTPAPINAPTVTNVVQPNCDNTNGSFEVVVQNAADEYSANGSPFTTDNIFTGLASGSFSITTKNPLGCISLPLVVTLQVTGTLIVAPIASLTQPTCEINSGTIEVGGQDAEDEFSFDGGDTFQTSNRKSGLAAGDYDIQIRNEFGCLSSIETFTIDPLKPIPATPNVNTQVVDCIISMIVDEQFSTDTYSLGGSPFQTSNAFTNVTSGSYTVRIKNSDGCIANTLVEVAPIAGAPDAPTLITTQPTCTTPLGTVEANPIIAGIYTYSFDNGASFQTANINSSLAPRDEPYQVRIKNNLGCTSPASLITIFNAKPTFTVEDRDNGSDLDGATTSTCEQTHPNNISLVRSNNAQNVKYFWTVSDRTNISNANSLPSAAAIEATSFNLILGLLNRQNQGSATYTFRAISDNCISDETRSVVIQVNPTPNLIVARQNGNVLSSGSLLAICSSDALLLNFSNSFNVPSTTYSWDTQNVINVNNAVPGASTSLNQSLFSATGNTPGSVSYVFKATANGCSSTETTVNVNVNPVPLLQINGTSQTFCEGNSTNITLSNPNSVNNTRYVWSSLANGLSGATNQSIPTSSTLIQDMLVLNQPKNAAATVSYTIQAVASGCSSDERTFSVTVNPVPVLVIQRNGSSITSTSSLAICSSSPLVLDFSNTSNIPNTAYSWVTQGVTNVSNSGPGTNNSLNQLLTCTDGRTPGSLSYIIQANSNGCLSSAGTINVNVKPVPLLQTNGNSQTLCDTNPTNITLSNPNSVNNTGYVWASTPNGLSGATNQSIPTSLTTIQDLLVLSSPNNAATVDYSIQAIADGCASATQPVSVTLNPVPDVAVNAPPKICNGSNLTISLSRNVKNIANTFYEWRWVAPSSNLAIASETSGSTFNSIQQVLNLTNNNNGSANLTYEIKPRTAFCNGTVVTTQVTVNANPTLTINPSFDLCSNAPFTFPLGSLGGAPSTSYSWNLLTINNVSNVNPIREGATLVETLSSTDGINSGTAIYEIRSISADDCISQPVYTVANVAPKPIFTLQNGAPTICSGTRTNILFNTTIPGSQLLLKNIVYNGVEGGAVTPGVSRFVDNQLLNTLLVNNTNTNLTVEYEFEPLSGSCAGEIIRTSVTVIPAPKIDLTVANETVCSGTPVKLNFASTNGTTAVVKSVNYAGLTGGKVVPNNEFNNGQFISETLVNNSTTEKDVTYSFELKNGVCKSSDALVQTINVQSKDSKLTIKLLDRQVCEGDNTEITPVIELGSGATIKSFKWNFDDGFSFEGVTNIGSISHKFSSAGTYNVSLNVVSNFGCTGSSSKSISIYPLYKVNSAKSYFEDFEQLNTGWGSQKFDLINNFYERSDSTSWIVKAPDGETIKGVSNAWWTGRNYTSEIQGSSANQFIKKSKSYYNNENSTLNSPCFFIEKSENQMISFNSFVDLQNNIDGVVLQYSVDDTNWANVGVNKEGWNWYTGVGITSRPGGQTTGPYGWTGNSSRKWRASKFSLNDNSIFNKNVRFRFAFSSDGSNPPNETSRTLDGFALDDFFIGNKDGKVLVEQLINYNSFDAMLQNKFIDDLYDAELSLGSSNINRISYHVSFPSLDSLNQSNPNDPAARSAYYGISSTPNTFLNGLTPLNIKSGANQLKVTVDSLSLKGSPFDLSLTASNGTSTSKLDVALLIKAKTSFTRPVLAYIALVDKEIIYKINGTDTSKLRNVVRKLLSGGDGKLIAQNWTMGQTLSVLLKGVEIDVPINNPNKLALIAFLQDKSTKEIYQNVSIAAPTVKPRLVTGLDESKDSTIFIFPNPASKQFQFTYFDAGDEWVLVNQIGSVVQSGKAIQTPNQLNTVNIEGLQNGVYFFKIHLKNKQAPLVRKLIVLN